MYSTPAILVPVWEAIFLTHARLQFSRTSPSLLSRKALLFLRHVPRVLKKQIERITSEILHRSFPNGKINKKVVGFSTYNNSSWQDYQCRSHRCSTPSLWEFRRSDMQRSQTIFIGCLQICSVLLNTNFKMAKKSLFFFDLVVSKGYPSNEHHRRLKLGKPLVCRTINSHKLEMSHLNIKKEKKKKKKQSHAYNNKKEASYFRSTGLQV